MVAVHTNEKGKTRVAIIGGGIAGLVAAKTLGEVGGAEIPFDFNVFEATDRTGGRALTKFRGMDFAEIGATFVGQRHRELRALARDLKVDLIWESRSAPRLDSSVLFADDSMRMADLAAELEPLVARLTKDKTSLRNPTEAVKLTRLSAEEYLRSIQGLSVRAFQVVKTLLSIDCGEWDRLSAFSVIEYGFDCARFNDGFAAETLRGDTLRFREGTASFIDALTEPITQRVKHGNQLTSVRYLSDGRLELSFENRKTPQRFDAIIFAAPPSALGEVELSGLSLSSDVHDFIDRTTMAEHWKITVWGLDRIGSALTQTRLLHLLVPFGLVWEENLSNRTHGALSIYFSRATDGENRVSNPEELAELVLKQIEANGRRLAMVRPLQIEVNHWPSSYQVHCVGDPVRPKISSRQSYGDQHNIVFAGDALGPEGSFMNSAVVSGNRAGLTLLNSGRNHKRTP